uniref:Antennapedia n=1 Tax=Steinernema glaseri TaxID=37863 RepID=A0A1I8AW30_9BILA
ACRKLKARRYLYSAKEDVDMDPIQARFGAVHQQEVPQNQNYTFQHIYQQQYLPQEQYLLQEYNYAPPGQNYPPTCKIYTQQHYVHQGQSHTGQGIYLQQQYNYSAYGTNPAQKFLHQNQNYFQPHQFFTQQHQNQMYTGQPSNAFYF